MNHASLTTYDFQIAAAIADEVARQKALVELVASENYVSRAVMKAQGTQMPNTYAEDCPGKRYHGGCQNIDVVGQLSIDRAGGLNPEPAKTTTRRSSA
jgi:glycine hydroxymethyltransferase